MGKFLKKKEKKRIKRQVSTAPLGKNSNNDNNNNNETRYPQPRWAKYRIGKKKEN